MARRVKKLKISHHVKRVHAHHKKHKKRLLKLYHKIRQHPGAYKPGYGPKRGAKLYKSHPRKPKGLNKRGSGLWDHVKKAWNWLTNHKVVKEMKKEVVNHAKKHGQAIAKEVKDRAVSYGKGQMDRGAEWLRRQGNAAAEKVRGKVEKHLSDASNKVEGVVGKVDKFVSHYTGATDDMPGRTVAAKKGSGWRANVRKNWGTGKNLMAVGRMAGRAGRRIASRA
jgi:hypothetical protein